MKYFDQYLKESENMQEIDIAVHCDINIFEWLVKYMQNDQKS
jgi:hypothetical protein